MLFNILMTIVVAGIILWLINRKIPMPGLLRKVLSAIVVFAVLAWLLGTAGIII